MRSSANTPALFLALVLALVEAGFFLRDVEGVWTAAIVALGAAAAGAAAARTLPARVLPLAAALGLLLPWLLAFAALVAFVFTEDSALEPLGTAVWLASLGSPVAVAALAGAALLGRSVRAAAAVAAGVAGLSLAVAGLAGDWFQRFEPPPARYARVAEERGAYGPVAIGDSREELFAAFGRKARASLYEEPMIPTGVEGGEGTAGPLQGGGDDSEELYRYPDAIFWLDEAGAVAGFTLSSPGARTSRGIEVGSDLDDVRAAYAELDCGEAPDGDFSDFPYCPGRVAPNRWIWFGEDPVTTISVSAATLG